MTTNNSINEKILYTAKYEYDYFLKKANVLGLGLGYKIKNGFNTNEMCIKVLVSKKIYSSNLQMKDLIPKYYKGLKTDVVESGIIKASKFNARIRPTPGGYSIGPSSENGGGTMACLVTDKKYYYVLSCSHILSAENKLPLDSPIIQPSLIDGGQYPKDEIANLSKYIPIKFISGIHKPENFVDCAMGKVTKRSQVSTKIALIGRIKGRDSVKLKEHVQKVGRTSELTTGEITSLGSTIIVRFDTSIALFKNLIITTSMSVSGDSGALLLSKNIKALGLFFAESNSNSFIIPIDAVLKDLDVTIVTG